MLLNNIEQPISSFISQQPQHCYIAILVNFKTESHRIVEANSDSIARMAQLFSFSCDNLDLKYVSIILSLEKLLLPPATITGVVVVNSIFKIFTN
jgi:hypothetical protein